MAANRQSKRTDIDLGGDDRPMPADIELVVDSAGAAATTRGEGPELALTRRDSMSAHRSPFWRKADANRAKEARSMSMRASSKTAPSKSAAFTILTYICRIPKSPRRAEIVPP